MVSGKKCQKFVNFKKSRGHKKLVKGNELISRNFLLDISIFSRYYKVKTTFLLEIFPNKIDFLWFCKYFWLRNSYFSSLILYTIQLFIVHTHTSNKIHRTYQCTKDYVKCPRTSHGRTENKKSELCLVLKSLTNFWLSSDNHLY